MIKMNLQHYTKKCIQVFIWSKPDHKLSFLFTFSRCCWTWMRQVTKQPSKVSSQTICQEDKEVAISKRLSNKTNYEHWQLKWETDLVYLMFAWSSPVQLQMISQWQISLNFLEMSVTTSFCCVREVTRICRKFRAHYVQVVRMVRNATVLSFFCIVYIFSGNVSYTLSQGHSHGEGIRGQNLPHWPKLFW